jgi:hypothetical protein
LFSGNQADSYGGALFEMLAYSTSDLTILNNTFFSNHAGEGAGALEIEDSALILNNTFSSNQAPQKGASLYIGINADVNLRNNIFEHNLGTEGCYRYTPGNNTLMGNNNLADDGSPDCLPTIIDDPLLGSLADNGGSTLSMALLPDSPAIDAGDDANCPASDQRGVIRPQGPNCDIGSYEYEPPAATETPAPTEEIPTPTATSTDNICIAINASVAEVYDPIGYLNGSVNVGDDISGTYIYNLYSADESPDPTIGLYPFSSDPAGFILNANGLTFRTFPDNAALWFEIQNDHGDLPIDSFKIFSDVAAFDISASPNAINRISWQLDDPSSSVLSSDALPGIPPDLSNWQSLDGLMINSHDPVGGGFFYIQAHVASAYPCGQIPTVVPTLGFPTPEPTYTPTPTLAPTPTPTDTETPTSTVTSTPTDTPTPTITNTLAPTAAPAMSVIINEVAWGGTAYSYNDEWIELHNPGTQALNLEGWHLVSTANSVDIGLTGTISAGGYYLLERDDDSTVSDIAADQIYSGDLAGIYETLRLYSPAGTLIDSANADGGTWNGGSSSPTFYSMERLPGTIDGPGSWVSNIGVLKNGIDAGGNPINGTPKSLNWAYYVTPTPSKTPSLTRTPSPTRTRTPTRTPTVALPTTTSTP